jgi:hypothetical protein
MRKNSRSRTAIDTVFPDEQNNADGRPRHVSGATITSWRGSPAVDLLTQSGGGPTITGAAPGARSSIGHDIVVLSDGTWITFVQPVQ